MYPVVSDQPNSTRNDEELACKIAKDFGIESGKQIIIAGYPQGQGATNMMKIIGKITMKTYWRFGGMVCH